MLVAWLRKRKRRRRPSMAARVKKKSTPKKKATKKDACYHKVKRAYTKNGGTWPSAYGSGALVKCRKVGAKNWGKKSRAT